MAETTTRSRRSTGNSAAAATAAVLAADHDAAHRHVGDRAESGLALRGALGDRDLLPHAQDGLPSGRNTVGNDASLRECVSVLRDHRMACRFSDIPQSRVSRASLHSDVRRRGMEIDVDDHSKRAATCRSPELGRVHETSIRTGRP